MAEEFQGGVSCPGNWWNLPNNLFASSPCLLDYPNHDTIATKGTRSSDEPPVASASPDDWNNRDFFLEGKRSIYVDHIVSREIEPPLDSSNMSTGEFFNGGNPFPTMDSATSSFLQTLFDSDDSDHHQQYDYSNYDQIMVNQQNHFPLFTNTPSATTQSLPSSLVGPKKSGENEPKRARIQTPSPLPTFKVRKEKLRDRVAALQQLVSPFGKTDTASVLHEAVEYIKFLHDQVTVLSTPYLKKGSPQRQNRQGEEDLKSRDLCLVPISSTFPVTAETNTDFWTPIFGESFK